MADNDKTVYEARLDAFELYHKYEYPERPKNHGDWKTAALRGPGLPALGHAVAGAAGSAVSNVATYPLRLIVTRLQMQRLAARKKGSKPTEEKAGSTRETYSGIVDAAQTIYAKEGGVKGFFTGVGDDTWKTIADSFLFFLAYTALRQQRLNSKLHASGKKRTVLPILDELAVGVLAGAFSKFWTTPLANIVTRKQTAAFLSEDGEISTKKVTAQIQAEKGITGFWAGYSASLFLTLNPSITFFLNEFLKYALLPRNKRQNPPAAATFLLAAISKAVASTITYPVSLAKTRLQADSSSDNESKDTSPAKYFRPEVFFTLQSIAVQEGIGALYDGLFGEVLKGFLSHGITMLTKDVVHSSIVNTYYTLLILLNKYPSPDELMVIAREQAEAYAEVAREGAKELAETVKEGTWSLTSSNMSVDMTSNASEHSPFDDTNELAEIVGDYVEDDAAEWRSLYHWFWSRFK
ncbi:putative mitochondrial carrier protein [Talaromyces proteolyticus]|uniref:Mitochondrial carrier protein n=1 Tax=Talaromyces proteolyticus TaxID=1131652 RepID=A0AAD4L1M7_9EURO|nr:putative mitochondrial carrier protein [Talaromyces proteolyticus]KAH8705902.1 putative mitochondrial carrier protein [Talaromyces proteolyticus]